MKNMKKEFMVLGVIIILLLAYLVMKKKDNVHYDLPDIPEVNLETLDKIEIIKPDQTITLVKKDNKWQMAPEGFPTNEEKVKTITQRVSQLILTDLVSRAKNYALYQLDKEKAVAVKAYSGEKTVRQFEIGKAAATYGHTFVKLQDDPNVYHAQESFRTDFDIKADDLRNKNVMKLDQNEITEVAVQKGTEQYQFVRTVKSAQPPAPMKPEEQEIATQPQKPEDEIYWTAPDGKKGKKTAIDGLIGQLANLDCQQFITGKTKEDFSTEIPEYKLKLKGSKDFEIVIYKKLEDGDNKGKQPAYTSENPYPFLLDSWKADQIMKKPEELIDEPKAEEPKK